MARVRLYLDQPLAEEQTLTLSADNARYLFTVMRMGVGDSVLVFNGIDGEWEAHITEAQRRTGILTCVAQTAPQANPLDLWLLFAPLKKTRTDYIVEKAAEMGAARIHAIRSEFTNTDRIHRGRLQAHAVEAAEQCGGTFVPEVVDMTRLDVLLDTWPEERRLMFCDEDLAGTARGLPEPDGAPGPWAILIGPEGGFSPAERARLHDLPQAHPVALGPRILRADTAAVAALALWQARLGDWR